MAVKVDQDIHWRVNAKTDSRSIIRLGFWSVGFTFMVFLLWAFTFPLASAVITPGTIHSDGKNKQVQHQSGGRIREIFVSEGERVNLGQPIIALDDAQVRAELTQLEARHASLEALKSRLDAERSGGVRQMAPSRAQPGVTQLRGAREFKFDENEVLSLRGGEGAKLVLPAVNDNNTTPLDPIFTNAIDRSDPTRIDEIEFIESQREAYFSGRDLLAREIESLNKKAATLLKQKEGVMARVKSQQAMLDMHRREYERLKPLADQGYVARNRLNERERMVLEFEGTVAALKLDGAGIDNQVDEVRVQIRKSRIEYANTAAQEYAKIVSEQAEISDKLLAARQSVDNSVIKAPVAGTLSKLLSTTVGGIIGAADLIGEIVPEGAPLVVQARVHPSDIDYVQVGQEADISITAFNRRIDDKLQGRVAYKSADSEKDEKTGEPYFTVRLDISDARGKGRNRLKDVQAGMQGEVYIKTGSRTFMTYLAKPMIDSFRRAFREQ